MKIIGCDPGLANFAIAVVEVETRKVLRLEVIRTEKSQAMRKVRVADDTSDRARLIARVLLDICADPSVVAIGIEATAFPFGKIQTKVISGLGRVRGLVDAIAELHGLPIVEEIPGTLKKLVTGARDASKEEVRAGIEKLFPGVEEFWPPQKTLLEHAGDCMAAAYAALQSDVVKAAIRARSAA